ncbi:MAG: hypothetical protein COY40_01055 [Alphaproteobacteria bacterium CG_4_10_14_0_8_um_filter_53_9]|nr:MAG: hypothetical protein COY40_01055 [Alphaproteobacteria bacterium CG_4_10_14_0_8_um_filter_53_9]
MNLKTFALTLLATTASAQTLNTNALLEGLDIGARAGYYRYSENPNFMELEGVSNIGVDAAYQTMANVPFLGQQAVRIEGRLSRSQDGYSSASGFTNGNESTVAEVRTLLVGRYDVGSLTLNPYWGYGYRYLKNDLQDTATALGYERTSQYHYLPLGTWLAMPVTNKVSAIGQVEYAPLIYGRQHSAINSGLDNTQTSGHHIRLFGGARYAGLTVGPYAEFWRVDDSDTSCASSFCGYEPKNFTREVGVKATYHFGGAR